MLVESEKPAEIRKHSVEIHLSMTKDEGKQGAQAAALHHWLIKRKLHRHLIFTVLTQLIRLFLKK